jgi:hypothetical protein
MSLIVNIHVHSMRDLKWFPRQVTIPLEKEQDFREWSSRNHSQTVERLNERGGMDPIEIWMAWNHIHSIVGITRTQRVDAMMLCVEHASDKVR